MFCIFLFALFTSAFALNTHNIIYCNEEPDSATFTTSVLAFPKDLQDVVDITVKTSINMIELQPISCVKILNQADPKDGGYPAIESGGIEGGEVSVRLVSQTGKGLNYTIEVSATPWNGRDKN